MVRRRYPLHALGRLRDQRVEEETQRVAARSLEARRAAERLAQAAAARQAEEQRVQAVLAEEAERADAGVVSAGELQGLVHWRARAAEEVAARHRAERAREAELAQASNAERQARQALAQADADANAVERHRAGWQAEQDRAAEQAVEEQALEVWMARRGSRA